MPKHLMMLGIGLFFGSGLGFVVAAASGVTLDGHDHSTHRTSAMAHTDDHDHTALLNVGANHPIPSVTAQLNPDGPNSWTLHLITQNFSFAPQNANQTHTPGEGHAHLYVDGEKLARLYGPWHHIASLPEGAQELRVTLNANSHETLALDGQPIEARLRIAP